MRIDGRENLSLRDTTIEINTNKYADGSCIISCGDTKVLCTATVEETVPFFLRKSGLGWVTAEYGMLPRSTNERMNREANRGKQSGRTMEIQRLIGRSLRQVVDLDKLTGYTITIDCDVIQADGGTRTASITGGTVALYKALQKIEKEDAIKNLVAAISVGIYKDELLLDLDYEEDSNAQCDVNIVMNEALELIEIQGTGEEKAFSKEQFKDLVDLAENGLKDLFTLQKEVIKNG